MSTMTLTEALAELESAEDFLNFFEVEYDMAVVQVNRLHILQRFHDYLRQAEASMPADDDGKRTTYKQFLQRAYQDFVESDAQTEKVFKVFHEQPHTVFMPVEDVFK